MVTARSHGSYEFLRKNAYAGLYRDSWAVTCGPAAMTRLKRTFGRVQLNRQGGVLIGHTIDVARDLTWFFERYPMTAHCADCATRLQEATAEHLSREERVQDVLTGRHVSSLGLFKPTNPVREYQQQAVDLLRISGSLLLTDSVGLGKTFTGLLALTHEDALPAVVVPPTHLPERWQEEFAKSFPWLRYHIVKKGTPYSLTDKKTGLDPDVIVVPYSKLRGWADHLAGKVRTVIFDEVQDLRRGAETEKGKAAGRLADACTYRLGLTATPVFNYAGEFWHLMNIIAPDALGSKDEFQREWATSSWSGHMKVGDPAALGDFLRDQGVMLGRTRKEVGRELPDTIRVEQHCQTDPDVLEKAAGDAAEMARLILDESSTRQQRFLAAGEIDILMRQATGIAKAPYVAGFARLLLESEDKIVIFGWHRAVYDLWRDLLGEFKPVMYTGTESPTQKTAALKAFKTPTAEGGSRVLLMSLRSGAGVDGLQEVAKVAVFGELDWSPQVHEQAIGRVARDGMGNEPAVAYFMVADDGSDPAIAEVLQVKRFQNDAAISPDGKLLNVTTMDVSRGRLLAEQAVRLADRKATVIHPPTAPPVQVTAPPPVWDVAEEGELDFSGLDEPLMVPA